MINIFKKIERFIYCQRVLIYSFDTSKENKVFKATIPILICSPTLSELMQMNRDKQMDLKVYPWNYLKNKIKNNLWECIAAKYENKFVGYIFYSITEMSFAGSKLVEFKLPENAGYPFRLFIHPDFRNLQIGKQLEQEADERIKKSKHNDIVIAFRATNSTNKIQLHNYKKLGGTCVGSVTFLKSRFFNTAIVSRGIKTAGLRIKKP